MPIVGRILGIEPDLDRRARRGRGIGAGERLALSHGELESDEVEAGRQLGDRVLDLETGVHLEEPEATLVVGEELHGAGTDVVDRRSGIPGGGIEGFAHLRMALDEGSRCLLDDLLVAALDRTLTLANRPDRAVSVGHDLDLDVMPGLDVVLDEDGGVTEGRGRLSAGGIEGRGEVGQGVNDPHAAPAATSGCLDEHGEVGLGDGLGVHAVEHRHARLTHEAFGLDLAAHRANRAGGRADPGEARCLDGFGEVGVLGEEAVAGVNRVGTGSLGCLDDEVAAQVGVCGRRARQVDRDVGLSDVGSGGIGVGEDRDRA